MSVRALSVLALGALLVLAGCSGGGDNDSSDGKSESQESASASASPKTKYTKFEDFDGDELLAVDLAAPMGLRTKVVDAAWQTELADRTAQAGSHILAVYVAVTPELDDRSLDDAKFHTLTMGLRSGASVEDCKANLNKQPIDGYCRGDASVSGQLEKVADDQWREHTWRNGDTGGVPLEPGQTLIGVVGFEIADSAEIVDDTLFCAPDKNDAIFVNYDNCVSLPKLDQRG